MSIEPIPPVSKRHTRRNEWREKQINTLLLLHQKFPQTFARLNARTRRPLKVGIYRDITAAVPEIGIIEIKRALRYYCGDLRYHRACVDGADRLDLAGNVAGTVTTAAPAPHDISTGGTTRTQEIVAGRFEGGSDDAQVTSGRAMTITNATEPTTEPITAPTDNEYERHLGELVERFVRERGIETPLTKPRDAKRVAENTFQAVAYVLRSYGMRRLDDPWLTTRLGDFSDAQITALVAALKRMQPRYAAITNELIAEITKLEGPAS